MDKVYVKYSTEYSVDGEKLQVVEVAPDYFYPSSVIELDSEK